MELFLRYFGYLAVRRVFIWKIHQMHSDIAKELVKFREHRNNGNFRVMR